MSGFLVKIFNPISLFRLIVLWCFALACYSVHFFDSTSIVVYICVVRICKLNVFMPVEFIYGSKNFTKYGTWISNEKMKVVHDLFPTFHLF